MSRAHQSLSSVCVSKIVILQDVTRCCSKAVGLSGSLRVVWPSNVARACRMPSGVLRLGISSEGGTRTLLSLSLPLET